MLYIKNKINIAKEYEEELSDIIYFGLLHNNTVMQGLTKRKE